MAGALLQGVTPSERPCPHDRYLGGNEFACSDSKCMASLNDLSSAAAAAAAPGPCTGTLGLMPVLCKASAAVSGPLLSTA